MIELNVRKSGVMAEVAKVTDYTGAKLTERGGPGELRDSILMTDGAQRDLDRFWDEAQNAVCEVLKECLISGGTVSDGGEPTCRVQIRESRMFDKTLRATVESLIRSFFIASITGQWFRLANKEEAEGYMKQAGEYLLAADRLVYSRRGPGM